MSQETRAATAPFRRADEERRTYTATEVRAASDGKLTGYAAVYNSLSQPLGFGRERLLPGCFDKLLATKPDVRLLVNHDPSLLVARTASGTMTINADRKGLYFEATPPDSEWGRSLLESVKRGDFSQCSFAFRVDKGGDRWTEERGEPIREVVTVAELLDCSIVTYPAYSSTSVQARKLSLAARRAELTRIGARIERDERRAQLERLRRSWSAPGPVYTPLSADLVELDRRRRALADRVARDPAAQMRTLQANARAIRQKAEVGALPAGSFRGPDGFWRAPE